MHVPVVAVSLAESHLQDLNPWPLELVLLALQRAATYQQEGKHGAKGTAFIMPMLMACGRLCINRALVTGSFDQPLDTPTA